MPHISTRTLIGCLVVLGGGLIVVYTVLSQRGVFPVFWNILIGAIVAGISFIVGILIGLYSPNPGTASRKTTTTLYSIAAVIDVIAIIASIFIPVPSMPFVVYCSNAVQSGQAFSLSPERNGIGVTRTDDGQFIGISDGSFAFDTGTASNDRADTPTKCQAAAQFARGEVSNAQSSWNDALRDEPNDAEEHIYQEDQHVLASGKPYVTLVVATMLTGNDQGKIGVGRDTLQGAYTAQLEYNSPHGEHTLPNQLQVLILIANAGSNPASVQQVTQQIIRLAHADSTFIGVIGWNFSSYATIELPLLNQAQIPVILPTASVDQLPLKPFAFRITPTDKKEASIAKTYIQTQLHAQRILLFVDHNDPFSNDLANDLIADYGYQFFVDTKTYTVGNPATLQGILDPLLLQYDPDLIYFAGYPNDLITLAHQLPQTGHYASLKIMGGDSLYAVNVQYPSSVYKRLLFTADAFPDVWLGRSAPIFYSEYAQNFDPNNLHPGDYGWSRADADSILNYDAVLALLNGCTEALSGQVVSFRPTPQQVAQGLNNVTPFQGASGLVSLQDDNGDDASVNKVIVMLTVNNAGHTQPVRVYGCLTQEVCLS